MKEFLKAEKTLNHFAELAKNWNEESKEIDCDIIINEEGKRFKAYSVSVGYRDLLVYCDIGTINYVVDVIGDELFLGLINVELDNE